MSTYHYGSSKESRRRGGYSARLGPSPLNLPRGLRSASLWTICLRRAPTRCEGGPTPAPDTAARSHGILQWMGGTIIRGYGRAGLRKIKHWHVKTAFLAIRILRATRSSSTDSWQRSCKQQLLHLHRSGSKCRTTWFQMRRDRVRTRSHQPL